MKYTITILSLLWSIATFAQGGEGIQFTSDAWATILKKATDENKLIFLDAYTTWCGPCKKMTKEVFVQKSVGDYFNQKFINVKMDMEKGEGVAIAEKYSIKVYPTLLFIAGDGNLIHRTAGYHTVPQFLELGETATNPNGSLSSLDKRYAEGDREADFLFDYTHAKYDAMDGSHSAVAEEYLATQEDWNSDKNLKFIFYFVDNVDSKLFDYIIDNRPAFEEKFGQRPVIKKVQDLIYSQIYDVKGSSSLDQIDKLFKKVYPDNAKKLSSNFRMSYYRNAEDWTNYTKSATKHFKKHNPSPDELNDAAWTVFEVTEDKKILKQAMKWAKKSIKLDNNFFNNDTLAAIYFKLGDKSKAISAAKNAIDLAKSTGEDYSSTQELLDLLLKKE